MAWDLLDLWARLPLQMGFLSAISEFELFIARSSLPFPADAYYALPNDLMYLLQPSRDVHPVLLGSSPIHKRTPLVSEVPQM